MGPPRLRRIQEHTCQQCAVHPIASLALMAVTLEVCRITGGWIEWTISNSGRDLLYLCNIKFWSRVDLAYLVGFLAKFPMNLFICNLGARRVSLDVASVLTRRQSYPDTVIPTGLGIQ